MKEGEQSSTIDKEAAMHCVALSANRRTVNNFGVTDVAVVPLFPGSASAFGSDHPRFAVKGVFV